MHNADDFNELNVFFIASDHKAHSIPTPQAVRHHEPVVAAKAIPPLPLCTPLQKRQPSDEIDLLPAWARGTPSVSSSRSNSPPIRALWELLEPAGRCWGTGSHFSESGALLLLTHLSPLLRHSVTMECMLSSF